MTTPWNIMSISTSHLKMSRAPEETKGLLLRSKFAMKFWNISFCNKVAIPRPTLLVKFQYSTNFVGQIAIFVAKQQYCNWRCKYTSFAGKVLPFHGKIRPTKLVKLWAFLIKHLQLLLTISSKTCQQRQKVDVHFKRIKKDFKNKWIEHTQKLFNYILNLWALKQIQLPDRSHFITSALCIINWIKHIVHLCIWIKVFD